MIIFFIYCILKDKRLFNLLLAVGFATTSLGLLIATIYFPIVKETSPSATVINPGIISTDLLELAESESKIFGMTTGTMDQSFLKALELTMLSLYVFIAGIVVFYLTLYFCHTNASKVELTSASVHQIFIK